jgi:NADH dehydrogenase (ubiquinone) 1 alpha subcomplex subunit 2
MNQSWRNLVSKNVKEIRFVLSQTSTKSIGMKNWINNNFVALKKANPDTILLVRECKDVDPIITARYDYGAENKILCEYASEPEVEEILGKLVIEGEKVNSYIKDNKI